MDGVLSRAANGPDSSDVKNKAWCGPRSPRRSPAAGVICSHFEVIAAPRIKNNMIPAFIYCTTAPGVQYNMPLTNHGGPTETDTYHTVAKGHTQPEHPYQFPAD